MPKLKEPIADEDAQLGQVLEGNKQNPVIPTTPTSMPDEELDNYFNATVTQPPISSSFSMQQHLQIIEEELQKPFPIDLAILANLERSFLRVFEEADVPTSLRQGCADVAVTLSNALSGYQMYKVC